MTTPLICFILILFYIKLLYTLNSFISVLNDDQQSLSFIDALFTALTVAWLIINIFSISGPIVLSFIIVMFSLKFIHIFKYRTARQVRRLILRTQIVLLIILNIIIAINSYFFHFSFWHLKTL